MFTFNVTGPAMLLCCEDIFRRYNVGNTDYPIVEDIAGLSQQGRGVLLYGIRLGCNLKTTLFPTALHGAARR